MKGRNPIDKLRAELRAAHRVPWQDRRRTMDPKQLETWWKDGQNEGARLKDLVRKPLDETWTAVPGEGWGDVRLVSKPADVEAGDPESIRVGEIYGEARRKLAAQAPAMARVLGGMLYDGRAVSVSEIERVLRAAGVLP